MIEAISFLFTGILFGFVAGISPGPLLTLVISETIKYNKKAGIIIASTPILTDIPIVSLSVLILAKISKYQSILGIISILGALFIGYMAYKNITIKSIDFNIKDIKSQSFKKGIMTNLLNPHPYLFWIVVGAPTILKGYKINITLSLFFIIGFYLFLIGSKMVVVLIVDKSKTFLKDRNYLLIIRTLGFILLYFSIIFIKDSLIFLCIM